MRAKRKRKKSDVPPRIIEWGVIQNSVGHALRRASVILDRHYAASLRSVGLSTVQIGTLELIARNEGLSQKQIASLILTAPSVVVGAAKKLEARKLLTRRWAPHDRRNYSLSITERGRALLQDCYTAIERAEGALVGSLKQREKEMLIATLHRISFFQEDLSLEGG